MEEQDSSGGEIGKHEGCVTNPSSISSLNNNDSRTLQIYCVSIDRDTLALKLILFLYYGGMACIMPFFTVHMLTIGISIKETAIIYGVLPFTSFIGAPLIGFLADKLGRYKLVLIVVTIANALSHSLLLAVPSYAKTVTVTGEKIIIGNNAVTFWMYFIIRVIATIFMSACYTMLDATALAVGKRNPKAEFGVQRIFSVLGQATMSLTAGILVDWFSQGMADKDYSAAFHAANFLFLLNVLAYCVLELEVEKPGKNVFGDAAKLFHHAEVVVFLIMIFLLGNMWGFVKSYLFVFLKDELGAPSTLMGLTVTVSSVIAIPILFRADRIVEKLGRVNVMAMSFIVYFIRFIAYSHLTNAWWCLPFEAMEAFSYHLMWTAGATYCSILAPKGLLATLSGIVGVLHFRLGQGCGSFIGGYVIGVIQVRQSFWYFGIAAAVFGVLYFILNYVWLQKLADRRNSNTTANSAVEKGDFSGSAVGKTMKANAV